MVTSKRIPDRLWLNLARSKIEHEKGINLEQLATNVGHTTWEALVMDDARKLQETHEKTRPGKSGRSAPKEKKKTERPTSRPKAIVAALREKGGPMTFPELRDYLAAVGLAEVDDDPNRVAWVSAYRLAEKKQVIIEGEKPHKTVRLLEKSP